MAPEPTTDWYPPPPPPPPAAPPARRLERSRRDRKIAGVCGGLGDYFELDPVIFRIGFVVLTVVGGSGVLLYIAGMIFLPEEGRRRSIGESLPRPHGRPHALPVVLLVIGLLMLSGQMFDRRGGGFGFGFTLLAIGAFLIWRRSQRHDDWHRDDFPSGPDDGMYPPRWDASASSTTTTTSTDVPWTAPGVSPWTPADDEHPPTSEFDGLDPFEGKPSDADPTAAYTTAHEQAFDALPPEPEVWPPLTYTPPEPPPRPSSMPVLLSFLFVAGGVAALLSSTNTIDITAGEFLAGALIATGLALVVNAVRGGRARGLIALGVVLTIMLSAASVLRDPLQGGIGQRDWVPATLSQVEKPYRLGLGEGDLDLTHLASVHGKHVIAAHVGVGQLKVTVPSNINVIAKGDTKVGEVRMFGQARNNGEHLTVMDPPTKNSDEGTLELHLHVGVGQVEVDRAPAA